MKLLSVMFSASCLLSERRSSPGRPTTALLTRHTLWHVNPVKSRKMGIGCGPATSRATSAMEIGRICATAYQRAGSSSEGWGWGSDCWSSSRQGEVILSWGKGGPSRIKSISSGLWNNCEFEKDKSWAKCKEKTPKNLLVIVCDY